MHAHIEPHELLTHTPNIPLPQDLCMCCCVFLEVPLHSLLTTTDAALQVADTCHLSGVRKGLLDHPTAVLCFQHNTYHRYLFCLFTCFFSFVSIRPSAPWEKSFESCSWLYSQCLEQELLVRWSTVSVFLALSWFWHWNSRVPGNPWVSGQMEWLGTLECM